jgi:predicted Mrr-cat superfamily restriction endonuclease
MSFWLHRISHHAEFSYPLLEQGYLSIGFSDFADPEFLEKTFRKDWASFEEWFADEWGQNPPGRYSLWRFIAEMRKGDRVAVPSPSTFSVYEILEDKWRHQHVRDSPSQRGQQLALA